METLLNFLVLFATTIKNSFVAQEDGKGLSTNDLTNELKTDYDTAHTHSQSAHAPSNAQENAIESIKVNGVVQTPSGKALDLSIPTKISQLPNDSGFISSHPTVSIATDTTSTAEPSAGETFLVIDLVTRDTNGHVTKLNTKTVTLPAAYTKEEIDAKVSEMASASDAMVYKGTVGTGGTVTALPASHKLGDTYRVLTAGTHAGQVCEIGDLIICITAGTTANNAHWSVFQGNLDGAVIGPSSSTNNAIALFNGTTGKAIANSSKLIVTALTGSDNIPTDKAVQTFIASQDYLSEADLASITQADIDNLFK